ncbi:MmpS family transport accessory protein [Mycobacterium sp. 050128]|uniref:MmpS family transport accessory protein n=1 Tax=Mycobacterium sp. 050128 TaxID=3096112 RepID=UPI002EDB373B
MTRLLGRVWLPILIVVAAAVAAVTVMKARSIFGSDAIMVTPRGSSDTAESFNPKVVTYEVFGSAGTAVINYLDLDATPQRVVEATLPWSLTLRTTAPAATPNILAQGDGDSISCRITVNDQVKDERVATGVNAETFCLVKSA